MNYPVKPREIYIISPSTEGTVTTADSALVLCSFSPGVQTWFQAPDGVNMVVISDDAALIAPLD